MDQTLLNIQLFGAGAFGAVIGWYLYYVNRHRKAEVALGDLMTVIGIVGGAAVTSLFPTTGSSLFGAYGIGLGIGFFSYFLVLTVMVWSSKNFDVDWFLDGRRKKPDDTYIYDGQGGGTAGTAMGGGKQIDIG